MSSSNVSMEIEIILIQGVRYGYEDFLFNENRIFLILRTPKERLKILVAIMI